MAPIEGFKKPPINKKVNSTDVQNKITLEQNKAKPATTTTTKPK